MKTLKQLGYVQDTNIVKFPHGAIQDKTDLVAGTPVTRGLYNDLLQNIYKLLDLSGVVPTDTEDSETSQYQIIDALKKFSNELNDLQQVVTLVSTTWTVNFNIDLLPDNYVFVGKVTDNYVSGTSYTFQGSGSNSYTMTSDSGFNASDVVLVTIDQSNVKFLNLSSLSGENTIFTPFGTPISYNESNNVYYLSQGKLLTDNPSINDLQQFIKVEESNSNLNVVDVIIHKSHILCLVLDTNTDEYFFYVFELGSLGFWSITNIGFTFPVGTDNTPHIYCDGDFVYLSNNSGNSVNDYEFHKLLFDDVVKTMTFVSSFSLDNTFDKTTNSFITGDFLFTFINGELNKYELSTGTKTNVGNYNAINGVVFKQNGNTYYSNGDVGVKWEL